MKKTKFYIISIAFLFLFDAIQAQVHYQNTQTNNTNSSAIGFGTIASGEKSFASGLTSTAQGVGSTTLGLNNYALGDYSFTGGSFLKATGTKSIVIGNGYSDNHPLINNKVYSIMMGNNSDKPTFFISRSESFGKTGRIGIGNVTSPQAKLHLRADDGEEAAIFIEPHGWNQSARASLLLGNMYHGITADGASGLVFHTQSAYVFNEGNVGIGTEENLPETKLDVNGTVKMTGLRLYNQSVHTGYVLTCSGINGQAVWQNPDEFSLWSSNDGGDIYRMSKVGILTSEPKAELDINGNALLNSALIGKVTEAREVEWVDPDYLNIVGSVNENASKIMIPKGNNTTSTALKIINPAPDGEIQFFAGVNPNAVLRTHEFIVGNGNTNVDMKVNGKIWSHEVEVKLVDWWDEVLADDYKLMPLNRLENYIKTNRHLPDIPAEEEVLKNGVDLGKMNALLLKKVEELTLYVIEQQKRIEILEKKLEK